MLKANVQVKGLDRSKRSVGALLNKLEGHRQVLVGVQKGTGNYEDGTPIAVVAAANHFGTDKIPARPYLDVAIIKNAKRYSRIIEHSTPLVLRGQMELDGMLDQVGLAAAADVDKFIVDLRDPPNAPSTIARKKSSNPLVDTGNLRQSIRHEIAREPVEEGL